jgi:ABC-type multidrug transport system fused ATPase/permease subunit
MAGCWASFWATPIVFWLFTYGALLWRLADFVSDCLYVAFEVYGSEFDSSDDSPGVRVFAACLLAFDGLLVLLTQVYVFRVKRRISKHGLLEDPSYLYRISWVEFVILTLGFLFEDAPQLAIFVVVSQATDTFGLVARLQITTTATATVYFFAQAIRNFYIFRRQRRQAEAATHSNTKGLAREAARAPLKDFKAKNVTGKNTRKAIAAAVNEPRRAKKAKKSFDRKNEQIAKDMDAGRANAILDPSRAAVL